MTTATMDDDAFRAFRKIGLPEGIAAKVARIIRRDDRRDDEFVTKTERDAERAAERASRQAERETERDAARAVREAERKADRDTFAAKDDVTVLQTKAKTVDEAIISIDKRFERIEATIVEIKENAARTDERINGLQKQVSLIVTVLIAVLVPLQLLTMGGLFGLLTRGILWGVAP